MRWHCLCVCKVNIIESQIIDSQNALIMGTFATIDWNFQQDFADCSAKITTEPSFVSGTHIFQWERYTDCTLESTLKSWKYPFVQIKDRDAFKRLDASRINLSDAWRYYWTLIFKTCNLSFYFKRSWNDLSFFPITNRAFATFPCDQIASDQIAILISLDSQSRFRTFAGRASP